MTLAQTLSMSDEREVDPAVEQAFVDALEGATESTIVKVIDTVERSCAHADVRGAYWKLVTDGRLVPTADGRLRLAG